MRLEHSTTIAADPATVFGFFEAMPDNYERWHPDHVEFRWTEGDGLEEGAEAYFDEVVAGERRQRTVRFVDVEPDRYLEFRPTSRLVALLLPSISFRIEPTADGCTVTQRLRVRTGPVGAWLNRREFDAVRQHMAEEGANLKTILEGETDTEA